MTLYNPNTKKILIYTDGACKGNPGKGGWGAVIIDNNISKELSGTCKNTTNNIMEMTAAIKALSYFKTRKEILIFTDSKYVMNGIQTWLSAWKINNWKTSSKKPVKNGDLWKRLDALCQQHEVDWKWVKGHAGNIGNERADELARRAMEPYKKNNLS